MSLIQKLGFKKIICIKKQRHEVTQEFALRLLSEEIGYTCSTSCHVCDSCIQITVEGKTDTSITLSISQI